MVELNPMYAGVPFSPSTILAQGVNEADTVIRISENSVFPEGPNFATIGVDSSAETIEYAAVGEGLLSGCKRGVEGTAKAWDAGELIARNFTNADYTKLLGNVGAVDSEVSAHITDAENPHKVTAGHVGADPVGSAAAVGERVMALEGKIKPILCKTATLTASGWTGGAAPFIQTVSAVDVTTDTAQVVEVGISASVSVQQREIARAAMLFAIGKEDGQITVAADGDKPTADLQIEILIIG